MLAACSFGSMLYAVVPLMAPSACGTVSVFCICRVTLYWNCQAVFLTPLIVVYIIVRSGQAHRTLVGHTGPLTSLQFDDYHVVSGSMDRSVRVRIVHMLSKGRQATGKPERFD